mmetsp:Transcript_38823/g.81619  ORF Transcript_38823/g.81619 Transcript_38823/m.81619 type:complete len:98 (+) Transcript_38823:853-1146(+)
MESDVKIQCLSVMNVNYLVRTADEQPSTVTLLKMHSSEDEEREACDTSCKMNFAETVDTRYFRSMYCTYQKKHQTSFHQHKMNMSLSSLFSPSFRPV